MRIGLRPFFTNFCCFKTNSNRKRDTNVFITKSSRAGVFTVLGAIALTVYKETSQKIINLPPELSIMSLIC